MCAKREKKDGKKGGLQSLEPGNSKCFPILKSSTAYLIDTYTTPSITFFEKMDAVEKGLSSICLYSSVYVLGDLHKDTYSPYYGLSNSPHVDQTFYIQNPYYRTGGSQGITANLVKYKYTFTGTNGDTYLKRSWTDLHNMIKEYGKTNVPEEPKDLPELTWNNVMNTVGPEGSYVRLVLITSIFGSGGYGYTYLYDNGSNSYPGYFSNVWYDGRYFNKHEFFEKGTTFKDEHAATANIVIKDAVIPFPDSTDDKQYLFDYAPIEQT